MGPSPPLALLDLHAPLVLSVQYDQLVRSDKVLLLLLDLETLEAQLVPWALCNMGLYAPLILLALYDLQDRSSKDQLDQSGLSRGQLGLFVQWVLYNMVLYAPLIPLVQYDLYDR